ncbi:MAG: SH3 domain-containing protein [Clostridiaceae bacterium]|nr:SH3 domain-containing protein [Eubacteriales bacterium]
MKRFVALVAVLLILFSIAPAAYALQQNTTLYATQPVNMRYGPSTKYVIVGELATGDAVQYMGQSGSWYYISRNGIAAYVHSRYLSTVQPVVTAPLLPVGTVTGSTYAIATANVNVRTGPSTKYGKLGAIGVGQSAPILGSSGNWLMVQWGGQTGYVYKKYFTISSTPAYTPPATNPAYPVYPVYPSYPSSPSGSSGSWSAPTYPTYPIYSYPVTSLPIYTFDTQNAAFFDKLDRTGYFNANQNIYLGRFTDSQGVPNIRIANGTDINKVAADLKKLLNDAGTFRLTPSTLPVGVNMSYLTYYVSQLNATYQGLSQTRKNAISLAGIGYDPARDAVIVQLNGLSSAKIDAFKTYVDAWVFLQFESPYYYIP